MKCPKCNTDIPENSKFCLECGEKLTAAHNTKVNVGERKQISVLFSDLSGYTSISEKLDPEEVHDLMKRIYDEAGRIVGKYDGTIDKVIGDAIMMLFGIPRIHEDDPVRAIKTARELDHFVANLTPQYIDKTGRSLAMHSGISTGLVVSFELKTESEKERVLGDTINLASRLTGLAKAGQIVVSESTYKQAIGSFSFQQLEPAAVKGKEQPVTCYRMTGSKERMVRMHRLSGVQSRFIGRDMELNLLKSAALKLCRDKTGAVVAVGGEAGVGKSRLVTELKSAPEINGVQWLEAHAYAYTNNTPYYQVTDLLNRVWHITGEENNEFIKNRIESGIRSLKIDSRDIIPYLGYLYGITYPSYENIEPDFWKYRFFSAVDNILTAIIKRQPTIIILEDLQWSDPSSLELFRFLLQKHAAAALFICLYRQPFTLIKDQERENLNGNYQEIILNDLPAVDIEQMAGDMLKAGHIPEELKLFIQEKAEGNPFYLEEMINSLLDNGILVQENGKWQLTRPLSRVKLPSTIEGVISTRLDHLERDMKRLLQEASVIGRRFLFKILNRITEIREQTKDKLSNLEEFDLIRTQVTEPDLEYMFKHALTQDVAYNGILKKDRQVIHEKISRTVEELFPSRLPEFYETLAYHYRQTGNIIKAVDYLMKSAEKAVNRLAVEEANSFYQQAYELLIQEQANHEYNALLIKLLNRWSWVHWLRSDVNEWHRLLHTHEALVNSTEGMPQIDAADRGVYYSWLCWLSWCRSELDVSIHYGETALHLGETTQNILVIGLSCSFLAWVNSNLGHVDAAVDFGEKARQISREFHENPPHILFRELIIGTLGAAYCSKGDGAKVMAYGRELEEESQRTGNPHTEIFGHWLQGHGYLHRGDFAAACACYQKGVRQATDRSNWALTKLYLGMGLVEHGRFAEARPHIQEVFDFCESTGYLQGAKMAGLCLGIIEITEGKLNQGMVRLMKIRQTLFRNGDNFNYGMEEYLLGLLYVKMILEPQKSTFSGLLKNIGFILKYALAAKRNARIHLKESIRIGKETGMKPFAANAYVELGKLDSFEGKKDEARRCLQQAINLYEQMGAERYLENAQQLLSAIK